MADFLAADGLGDQADNERLKGVAQLQDILEAGAGHAVVADGRLAEVGFQYHHAFAGHGAHQAEGFQDDHRFAQAGATDSQLFSQFALPGQHLARAPLPARQGAAKLFNH
ncbi:hypothetical protein D3C81_1990650 [compost metagenome]